MCICSFLRPKVDYISLHRPNVVTFGNSFCSGFYIYHLQSKRDRNRQFPDFLEFWNSEFYTRFGKWHLTTKDRWQISLSVATLIPIKSKFSHNPAQHRHVNLQVHANLNILSCLFPKTFPLQHSICSFSFPKTYCSIHSCSFLLLFSSQLNKPYSLIPPPRTELLLNASLHGSDSACSLVQWPLSCKRSPTENICNMTKKGQVSKMYINNS